MRVAYLITAFHQYGHLKRLIDALSDESHSAFFVHMDKKSKMPTSILAKEGVYFIDRINVWWGGWSHQQAILNLMIEASKHHFDYYAIISGSDYPIRPLSFLYKKLEEGGEYINITKGFRTDKPELRIKYYYYDCFDRRNDRSLKTRFFLELERVQRQLLYKRHYPFSQIYHGTTWCTLSHECVSYVLSFLENHPDYISFYKTSWCPEESLIHTIIGNSPFATLCKGNLTYSDWSDGAPAIINQEHVALLEAKFEFESQYGITTPFFARKFEDSSRNVVELIEKQLRTE